MNKKALVTSFLVGFAAAYAFAIANKKLGGLPGLK